MKKPKAISFDIKGIKCDNPHCGWKDMTVEFDADKYLNAPCPKCGCNLFTEKDYRALKCMYRIAGIINFIFWPFVWSSKKRKQFKCNMDGSGIIKIEDIK